MDCSSVILQGRNTLYYIIFMLINRNTLYCGLPVRWCLHDNVNDHCLSARRQDMDCGSVILQTKMPIIEIRSSLGLVIFYKWKSLFSFSAEES